MSRAMNHRKQKQLREHVLSEIRDRQEQFVQLLSQVVQHPTENPPGNTVGLADFVADWLGEQGIETQSVEPQPTLKSVLSTFNKNAAESLHFMFNGHLDVFPSDDPQLWQIPPFEGRIEDGKVHGRGVGDMKGGLTASLIAYSLLHHLRDELPARVSLMAVADEEAGGVWGTKWILDNHPDWLPDACIIGEPCAPDAVRLGEKGISSVTVTFEGRSYHSSLSFGDNCILRMARALILMQDVANLEPDMPQAARALIDEARTHNLNEETRGLERILERPSFNIGRIEGGIKMNIVPRNVLAEVDIRVPFGITPDEVLAWIRRTLDDADLGDARVKLVRYKSSASFTDPQHPLGQIMKRNAAQFYGVKPTYTITTGATDGRFFRQRGIPTAIYGPRPQNCAGLDEYITMGDFLAVLKVHACSAIDYIAEMGEART